MTLTPARVEVIEAMDRLWRDHPQWRWPTIRELAAATGRHWVTVNEHLNNLADEGLVQHTPSVARGYQLTPPVVLRREGRAMPPAGRIPVVGVLRSEDGLVMKPVRRATRTQEAGT